MLRQARTGSTLVRIRPDEPERLSYRGRPGWGVVRSVRHRDEGENAVTRTALLRLVANLVAGCAPDRPPGAVGAIATAPIMFVSARMNDREDHLERARRNDRPMPPIDEETRAMAQATLEKALELGRTDEDLYGPNDEHATGHAAGEATVLPTGRFAPRGHPDRRVHVLSHHWHHVNPTTDSPKIRMARTQPSRWTVRLRPCERAWR